MNLRDWSFRASLMICLGLLLSVSSDAARKAKTAQVTIPFDFWIEDTKLPAGNYQMTHLTSPTLLVFTNTESKGTTEAFMLPVDADPVKESRAKLVFLVQNGEHYLYEAWGVFGRRVVTAQYGTAIPSGDNRVEVPLVYR